MQIEDGPVFVDFEASSLSMHSWPIEAGLAWLQGQHVIVQSKLIRPRPEWPVDDWSNTSGEVHGISKAELKDADTADDVALWLVETVGTRTLVSDAPEFDQRWLDRLLAEPGPKIEDFNRMLWDAFSQDNGTISPGRLHHAYKNMRHRKTIHRAGEDAANLCFAWRAGIGK